MECGSHVIVDDSESPGDDYDWRCANPACMYAAPSTGTGDMERPEWVVDSVELATARTTDPREIFKHVAEWIVRRQKDIARIEAEGVASQKLFEGIIKKYEAEIRVCQHQKTLFEDLLAQGQPLDYRPILAYQRV